MVPEDRILLKNLLTEQRVLSLSVMVDGKPYVSLLPFAFKGNLCAIYVQASSIAKHSRGMFDNAAYSILIHIPDNTDANPMEIPRLSLCGKIQRLEKNSDEFNNARSHYKAKFSKSGQYFDFADFNLYQLNIEEARFVAGFGRVYDLKREDIRNLDTL